MKNRCYKPEARGYKNFGGRGIKMHEPWVSDFDQFDNDVKSEIGDLPSPKHQLTRININGNYEPGNIKWRTVAEVSLVRNKPPKPKEKHSSEHLGVYYSKQANRKKHWQARLTRNLKDIPLGYFDTEQEAIDAVNAYLEAESASNQT
jgi:hypothetical protein